ncbi:MAG: hypothetical protein ACYTHN_08865 [Planctomycetota bacterium]
MGLRIFVLLNLAALAVGIGAEPVRAGASGKAWRKIRDEALKQYEEAYPCHWGAFEKRVEALNKIGAADCREAVDCLLQLFKEGNAKVTELKKRRKVLLRKMTALLAGGTLKKLAELNKEIASVGAEIFFHRRVQRRTSEGLALCKSQVAFLAGPLLKKADWDIAVEIVQALASIGTAPALKTVRGALHHRDYQVRTEALGLSLKVDLGEMEAETLRALQDAFWQVRATAIRIILVKKIYIAVGPLVEALQIEDGRLTREIDEALHALTGVRMLGDAALWKRWWEENGEAFEKAVAAGKVPGVGKEAPEKEEKAGRKPLTTTSFYGIDTASKNIVFVLDISGSMSQEAKSGPPATDPGEKGEKPPASPFHPKNNRKIEIAKCELKRAIANLPEDAFFNIIFYHKLVLVYRDTVFLATRKNKDAAYAYIDRIRPRDSTNIFGALENAFQIQTPDRAVSGRGIKDPRGKDRKIKRVNRGGVDTIFFLTDGKPTAGAVKRADDILVAVKLWNTTRKIQIHAVGVGDHDADFMQELAASSGGKYVAK